MQEVSQLSELEAFKILCEEIIDILAKYYKIKSSYLSLLLLLQYTLLLLLL